MTQTMSMKVSDSKKNCESIHSGQFMVSHFEQEPDEYQDYPVDDDECEEIAEPSTSRIAPSTSSGMCMELERYKPKEPERRISEVYEIDSDLSKIFDTLNVTYKWVFITKTKKMPRWGLWEVKNRVPEFLVSTTKLSAPTRHTLSCHYLGEGSTRVLILGLPLASNLKTLIER